jgi:hypothetical protein
MALHSTGPGRAACTPRTARLSASVPPPVNTTSPGRHPTVAATASRASSTTWRAARATRWAPDGFPKRSPSQGAMAAAASGRSAVVAA